jgi:hypothetical protein
MTKSIADIGTARLESDVRERGKDAFQDLANGLLADPLSAARMVFEDRIPGMHRENPLDIVAIPCLTIRGDPLLQRMLRTHGFCHEDELRLARTSFFVICGKSSAT